MDIDHSRLDPYRRQNSPVQEHVVDEFVAGRLSRRAFVRRATIVGIGLSSVGGILSACDSSAKPASDSSGPQGKSGATIRAGLPAPVGVVSPLEAGYPGDNATLGLCAEWLTLVDADYNVRPWLAESWTPNSDGTAWTFKIRQDVKFNDGTPMAVDDVVYSFKSQVETSTAFNGKLAADGVEKLDDAHVRFNLEAPVGSWPSYGVSQTNFGMVIVPKNYDYDRYEKEFPGTGRFKMERYSKNVGGTFVRNPHYWGTSAKPAKIEVTYFADEAALAAALGAGNVDCNDAFGVSSSPQLLAGKYNIVANKSSQQPQLSMRCDTGPFANPLVRQAMALTLDRPQIVDALLQGHGVVGNDSPFAPVFPSTDTSVPQRKQDIDKAKQLMAQAGVPRGFSCELATSKFLEIPQFAQIIKQSAAAIGIDINLSIMSESAYWGDAVLGQSPALDTTMSLSRWNARGVPDYFLTAGLQSITAKNRATSQNAAHFSDPQFDTLTNQYIAATDLSTQRKLAGQIQGLLLEQTPVIWAYFPDILRAMQRNVHGILPVPNNTFYWNMTKS